MQPVITMATNSDKQMLEKCRSDFIKYLEYA